MHRPWDFRHCEDRCERRSFARGTNRNGESMHNTGADTEHAVAQSVSAREGHTWMDRNLIRFLGSPFHSLLSHRIAVIWLRGAVSRRTVILPVQYVRHGNRVVLVPGRPETKKWWRNLRHQAPVHLLVRGIWLTGDARALSAADTDYRWARDAYRSRWRHVHLDEGDPIVLVVLHSQNGARREQPTPR